MGNKQQTAVTWLLDNLKGQLNIDEVSNIIDQAKEMEKKQMIDFAEQWQKSQNKSDIDSIEDLYYKTYGKIQI
jgi:secreted Zn-dependent insulinase-like peptidase